MQFQFNSDLPGVSQIDGTPVATVPRPPPEFPPVQPIPCAKITTRVYHPQKRQVATVQNVIVRIMQKPPTPEDELDDGSSLASSLMDDSSSSSVSDGGKPKGVDHRNETSTNIPTQPPHYLRAYWVQRTIRDAIYGRVLFAIVLKPCIPTPESHTAEWEVTNQYCAIKEMSWQHIQKEKNRLVEDPIKEVAAMQYIQRWYRSSVSQGPTEEVDQAFQAMQSTNLMMPLDLLADDSSLYSIMPYCDGGELFDRLDLQERFSEPEARYWMIQLLNGLQNLQRAGICHRDISLENLMVHKSGALVIDLGMCLRVPHEDDMVIHSPDDPQGLTQNFHAMLSIQNNASMNHGGLSKSRRLLMTPQGTCGKWLYMSPEVYSSKEPFDGYAVDLWAAGVVLFLMLTGFPPWERACQTDQRFKYMTAGYLVQMLTEWKVPISPDAMDLLQRMLFLDPRDRLSLEQVVAHPWIRNGVVQPPEPF